MNSNRTHLRADTTSPTYPNKSLKSGDKKKISEKEEKISQVVNLVISRIKEENIQPIVPILNGDSEEPRPICDKCLSKVIHEGITHTFTEEEEGGVKKKKLSVLTPHDNRICFFRFKVYERTLDSQKLTILDSLEEEKESIEISSEKWRIIRLYKIWSGCYRFIYLAAAIHPELKKCGLLFEKKVYECEKKDENSIANPLPIILSDKFLGMVSPTYIRKMKNVKKKIKGLGSDQKIIIKSHFMQILNGYDFYSILYSFPQGEENLNQRISNKWVRTHFASVLKTITQSFMELQKMQLTQRDVKADNIFLHLEKQNSNYQFKPTPKIIDIDKLAPFDEVGNHIGDTVAPPYVNMLPHWRPLVDPYALLVFVGEVTLWQFDLPLEYRRFWRECFLKSEEIEDYFDVQEHLKRTIELALFLYEPGQNPRDFSTPEDEIKAKTYEKMRVMCWNIHDFPEKMDDFIDLIRKIFYSEKNTPLSQKANENQVLRSFLRSIIDQIRSIIHFGSIQLTELDPEGQEKPNELEEAAQRAHQYFLNLLTYLKTFSDRNQQIALKFQKSKKIFSNQHKVTD